MTQPSKQVSSKRRTMMMLSLALIAMTAAAYWPATRCGYIWDDDAYVEKNHQLRSVTGLKHIWLNTRATPQYYPLVHTTYWIEYHLWGLNPAGYHTVNIVLHALSVVLLWRVLVRLKIPGAFAAAAIFAVHPVTVESVAWVTERKNVLSGVFYFGAMLAYLRFAFGNGQTRGAKPHPTRKDDQQGKHHPLDLTSEAGRSRRKWYVLALILFVCALLGKTVTATLPGALFLILWWKRDRLGVKDILSLVPFFAIGAVMGLFTAHLEVDHVGAKGAEWSLTWVERFLVAGRALCFYAGKVVWPNPLMFFYDRWAVSQSVWQQYLYLIPFPAAVGVFWLLRKRVGKGPLVAVLFFAGTLFPALGFLDVYPMRYSYVADHFQYLAMIGIITLITASGATLASRYPKRFKSPMIAVGALVVIVCGVLTAKQCRVYQGLDTLWSHVIAERPNAWMAYNNLGQYWHEHQQSDKAIECFKKTLEIKKDDIHAYNNLAILYREKGMHDRAHSYIDRALSFNADDPESLLTQSLIYKAEGHVQTAINQLYHVLELKPDFDAARLQLALYLSDEKDYARAIEQLNMLVEADACFPQALMMLGYLYKQQREMIMAIKSYEQVIRLDPSYGGALNNLALIYAADPDPHFRNPAQAVELASRACRVTDHTNPYCLDTLSAAYAAKGNFPKAITIAQQAIQAANQSGSRGFADEVRSRMRLYEQQIPYIQKALP